MKKWKAHPKYKVELTLDGQVRDLYSKKVKKSSTAPNHYQRINVSGKKHYIHVLMAETYKIKPSPKHTMVNHINGNRSDNRACNLEWVTPKENAQHKKFRNPTKLQSDQEAAILSYKDCNFTEEELKNQIWKVFPDPRFLGRVLVSTLGQIKMIKPLKSGDNKIYLKKAEDERDGYLEVRIMIGNSRKENIRIRMGIHQMVALTFLPNPENKPTVNHKDGNRKNNRVSNLEWATYKEQREDTLKRKR